MILIGRLVFYSSKNLLYRIKNNIFNYRVFDLDSRGEQKIFFLLKHEFLEILILKYFIISEKKVQPVSAAFLSLK